MSRELLLLGYETFEIAGIHSGAELPHTLDLAVQIEVVRRGSRESQPGGILQEAPRMGKDLSRESSVPVSRNKQ